MALLQNRGGEVRAVAGENLLRTLCDVLGLRKMGKAECDNLRILLLELAARGRVVLEFESDDSPYIMAVMQPGPNKDAEIERLGREVTALHERISELLGIISTNKGDVEAAASLVAEAESERDTANGTIEDLRRRMSAIEVAKVGRRSKDRREIIRLETKLASARKRITELEERVAALKPPKRRKLSVSMRSGMGETHDPGCGCIISRISTDGCQHGGFDHAWTVIAMVDDDAQEQVGEQVLEMFRNPPPGLRTIGPSKPPKD